ncbi:hypothetical protein AQUCO_00300885v1 [Aquilegia coerulea]|uniref:NAD(P)-binding domain-containing protein n=1 Tax=Aquilegia coerulea TaxID=218851 RepID=A0A2G5F0X9_AQUCA|nr:hypothetical protein AQUCO_00300885v1 [Aquilegia coerulea]
METMSITTSTTSGSFISSQQHLCSCSLLPVTHFSTSQLRFRFRFRFPSLLLLLHSPNSHFSLFTNFNKHTSSSSSSMSHSSSSSSTIGEAKKGLDVSSTGLVGQDDLLIVGPGVLGRIVAQQWKQEHPGCQIVGQTMTTDHHEELINIGIKPLLKGTESIQKFPYVIFCAPPSRTVDYPADVRLAASNWNGKGSFIFTSSSAPYDCYDNGPCDEDSPVVPIGRSPRTDVLLKAEKEVLEAGGCVLRLAGLYKSDRGAHTYWLEKGIVEARPDHILNLIHYEDAASLAIAILKKKLQGRIFLGCDNHPLSRQEVMDLVERSGKFNKKFQAFTGKFLCQTFELKYNEKCFLFAVV